MAAVNRIDMVSRMAARWRSGKEFAGKEDGDDARPFCSSVLARGRCGGDWRRELPQCPWRTKELEEGICSTASGTEARGEQMGGRDGTARQKKNKRGKPDQDKIHSFEFLNLNPRVNFQI
jgi:hypothetical protein